MSNEFYILSMKWTRGGDSLTWWAPNNNGYTIVLEHAGRYTEEQVAGNPDYYNNGYNTLAVPCDAVEAVAIRVVPHSSSLLEKLTGKRFKPLLDGDDDCEPCDSCGLTPTPTNIGMQVVGAVTS